MYLSPAARGTRVSSGHRTWRLRLGLGMMVLAAAGAVVAAPFGIARAQEVEQEPKPLEITRQAYWARSLGHVPPNVLVAHFPPTVVCLVAPDFCNSPLAPVLQGIDAQVVANQPETIVPGGGPADVLAQVMVGGEDHLPTGVIAGARRYLSAVRFELPTIPSGHRVDRFELVLTPVSDFTFHFDSPGFRQAILAILRGIQTEDPGAFQQEFEKVGSDNHPMVNDEVPLGVEACPIVEGVAWDEGSNQDAATAPERDNDERRTNAEGESELLPKQVDCILGANSKIEDGKWVFDLTLAANAWAGGRMPNNGVLLRPVLPPNLAYGDPDLSTFDQATFFSPKSTDVPEDAPQYVMATEEDSEPVRLGTSQTVQPQVLGAREETFTEVFGSVDQPATPLDAPARAAAPSTQGGLVPALSGTPVTEWWVWMLLPLFLAGAYLISQALTAEPAMAFAERSGAMTRLIEARRRGELL